MVVISHIPLGRLSFIAISHRYTYSASRPHRSADGKRQINERTKETQNFVTEKPTTGF